MLEGLRVNGRTWTHSAITSTWQWMTITWYFFDLFFFLGPLNSYYSAYSFDFFLLEKEDKKKFRKVIETPVVIICDQINVYC